MTWLRLLYGDSVYLFKERKKFIEAPAFVAECGPIIIVRCSASYIQHEINSGTTSHCPTTWNDSSTSVEVRAWFSNVTGEGCAAWSEMFNISTGLNMARDIARVLATLEDEDLQRGVCGG